MAVRHISQKPNKYYNVDIQDGLCERVDADTKQGKRGHREYFNVQLKVKKPNRKKQKNSADKEYWDVHVKTTTQNSAGSSTGNPQNDDVVPVRQESKRPNLPTPYSCIELTWLNQTLNIYTSVLAKGHKNIKTLAPNVIPIRRKTT